MELGCSDVIEKQLSHEERDVRGAYNRAQWLPERGKLMQWWADRLEAMRHGKAVAVKLKILRASRKVSAPPQLRLA